MALSRLTFSLTMALCLFYCDLTRPKNNGFRLRRQSSLVMPSPCFPSFLCSAENKDASEGNDKQSQVDKRDQLSLVGPSPCDFCGGGLSPALSLLSPPSILYSPWGSKCAPIIGCDEDNDENCVQLKITIKNCNGRDDFRRRPQVISVPMPPILPPFLPPPLPPFPPAPPLPFIPPLPPALPPIPRLLPPPPAPIPLSPPPVPLPLPPPLPAVPSPVPCVVSPFFARPPYPLTSFLISVRPYSNPSLVTPLPAALLPASPPIPSPIFPLPSPPPPPPPFIVPSSLPLPPPPPLPIPIVPPFPSPPPMAPSPDQIWHPPPMPLQPPLAPSLSPCQLRFCRRCDNCWPPVALFPCEGNGETKGQWDECRRRRRKKGTEEAKEGHFGKR